jgi:CIC family chloride channel protein
MAVAPASPRTPLERVRGWIRSLDFTLARRFGLATREDRLFFLLIPISGLLAGGLGLLVTAGIQALQTLLWSQPGSLFRAAEAAPWWQRLAAPAMGGLLVGLVIWLGKSRVGGHGTSSLIEAVALQNGRVEPRPVLLTTLAGMATVGSGGSLGREGPMISLGAMAASWLGSRARLSPQRVKILLGCGAAAGMAAIYNTPIGGALFAMEVILGNFALEIFGPIVVASVLSTLVARTFRGAAPIYATPDYTLISGWELLAYAGLGVVGALISILFILAMRGAQQGFARIPLLPAAAKPVLGMLMVGGLGIAVPYIYGNGFETITMALHDGLPWKLLLLLPLAKLAATAATSGSGGAGGMFTPSLFVGSLVGGAYGHLVHHLWPAATGSPGAYAAVGMAAIAAGTSHAPISAILILFEFTGNYDLILPLMFAAIISSLLANGLQPYSIYTESLRRKGIDVSMRMEEAVLAALKAEDLARPDAEVLRPGDDYRKVVETFFAARRRRLFVVSAEQRLLGAILLQDIQQSLDHPEILTAVVAADLMVPVGHVIAPGERLHRVTEVFAASDYERLPVVDADGCFRGVLAKRDLLAVYAQEVVGRPALLTTFISSHDAQVSRDYVELPPDFALRMLVVPPDLVGKTLAEARLPQTVGARVIQIKRQTETGEERLIPDGQTVLAAGDELVLVGPTGLPANLEVPVSQPALDAAGARSTPPLPPVAEPAAAE